MHSTIWHLQRIDEQVQQSTALLVALPESVEVLDAEVTVELADHCI